MMTWTPNTNKQNGASPSAGGAFGGVLLPTSGPVGGLALASVGGAPGGAGGGLLSPLGAGLPLGLPAG